MKKLFLAFLAFLTVVSAEISDANFKNAQTSQVCKKILDGGYFASYTDDFVFYSDDNKTKYFLSVFREKKRYILFRDKLPIDTNEA
ncbi:MAG: hypothetical protein LBS39_02970, partial [Campylobacteraceae bacterium]|nr:hypothetical protein [Campylobacteraceae bacterium]